MNMPGSGKYRARLARGPGDLARVDRLRQLCFRHAQGGSDLDPFDAMFEHVMIEEVKSDALVCCFRVKRFKCGTLGDESYSAQYFDLARLARLHHPMVEVGRFCIHPETSRPDIPRLAWAALTKIVGETNAGLLFGCTSFAGWDAKKYRAAFAHLWKNHRAPERLRPGEKAQDIIRFGALADGEELNLSHAMKEIPPLLSSYLALGGWVSDHAVIDADLGTFHVFTGVKIANIPKPRSRLLQADFHHSINMLW